ncbi:MAG: bifunctional pyr operon transcriptional regulator/uracil phosphoribosyltransferase PyrR [Desulfovibrionaceae bacterium]|nr:bifunctional pyr operon transcriptional regulator/uracil phosphoribosyltransferase PyrR [Desulfovibrionaceae bacterium]
MKTTALLRDNEISRIIDRLACQIVEKHDDCRGLMLVGIQRRGADLAARLCDVLRHRCGANVPLGTLDINFYRDDWTSLQSSPQIGASSMPLSVDGVTIILVDDVLFTGRTIRAALEALLDYGRPRAVELLVLVDRGHRELPIHADYVGRTVNTARTEQVNVLLHERDGRDSVEICSPD